MHSIVFKMNLLILLLVLLNFVTISSGERMQYNLIKLGNLAADTLESSLKIHGSINPDTDLSIEEYLRKYNYPLEHHRVTTEDGYILTLHRIPHGRNEISFNLSKSTGTPKPVVLLKHCFMCSAMDFLYTGPEKSLALILADTGYDVWLPNTRGNRYSMNHKTFNSSYNSSQFWNFSYHEKGYYDLPASIDYIINTTSVNNITFIGYSQGTTEGLILTSTRPEYNDKLNLMVLLSPIAYMRNVASVPVKLAHRYSEEINSFLKAMHVYGIPYIKLISVACKIFCNEDSPMINFCVDSLQWIGGYDFDQYNKSIFTIFAANTPSGFSKKELLHYAQAISSGNFSQYDYQKDNQFYYNSSTPPLYNISQISVPVAAYYGKNDFLATLPNVRKLLKEIPNLQISSLNKYMLFNHLDFIYAIDVKKLLYDSVIETVQKYNPT